MSHRDKIISSLIFVGILLYCAAYRSCRQDTQQAVEVNQELIQKVVLSKIGPAQYRRLWTMANDSISNWRRNHLKPWAGDTTKGEAKLDSIFYINSTKDKIVMANLLRELSDGKLDGIGYFYGVKIKEQWYFLSGPTMYLPRTDLQTPTSFAALHEAAVEHIFRAYLKKDAAGHWQINENFFGDLTSASACPYGYTCQTPQDWDKAYLYWVADNWKHRNPVHQPQ